MLDAYGKGGYSYIDSEHDWFSVFVNDESELGVDTDTLNIAESLGFCATTHNTDTDVSVTRITGRGQEALYHNAELFGYGGA